MAQSLQENLLRKADKVAQQAVRFVTYPASPFPYAVHDRPTLDSRPRPGDTRSDVSPGCLDHALQAFMMIQARV
ncbi:hypothetical protein VNO80_33240 [Phaseolus coccineus]|uniref:Uncharacterized protein n=1 Tax=Phaseolus coccineus TaxID=3886 RepID=A0AAN9Q643_PHACN